ncbi:hypothetical protein PTKIN_Ptkin08bG0137500 [Pterospermum kingtungense]
MFEEKWKIRGGIENDIDRDSEEEIKEGIYHLALRLHRLYQHKRESDYAHQDISESGDTKDKTLSEVNISIKMEGGIKIEIKQTKKDLPPRSSRSNKINTQLVHGFDGKKFDWAKSLRAETDSAIIGRKLDRSYQAKIPSTEKGFYMNFNHQNTRRNMVRVPVQRKGNIGLNNKVLELGWKY